MICHLEWYFWALSCLLWHGEHYLPVRGSWNILPQKIVEKWSSLNMYTPSYTLSFLSRWRGEPVNPVYTGRVWPVYKPQEPVLAVQFIWCVTVSPDSNMCYRTYMQTGNIITKLCIQQSHAILKGFDMFYRTYLQTGNEMTTWFLSVNQDMYMTIWAISVHTEAQEHDQALILTCFSCDL